MSRTYLGRHLRTLKFTRNYIFLAGLYGLSSLLIPFSVQLLVNNLALTGLWITTFSFMLLIGAGLALTLVVKYAQMILNEYLQRHLLNREMLRWWQHTPPDRHATPYFFECFNILKAFAYIVAEGFDLVLKCVFGAIALIFIHPAFLMVSLLFVGFLVLIRVRGKDAIVTSISESDRKYLIYDALKGNDAAAVNEMTTEYFRERDRHFSFIRRQAAVTFAAHFSLQLLLLGWGIHLIQINQLSLGQLISAEIIVSNIFGGLGGLPKLLESFYDFETSCYKLESAQATKEA